MLGAAAAAAAAVRHAAADPSQHQKQQTRGGNCDLQQHTRRCRHVQKIVVSAHDVGLVVAGGSDHVFLVAGYCDVLRIARLGNKRIPYWHLLYHGSYWSAAAAAAAADTRAPLLFSGAEEEEELQQQKRQQQQIDVQAASKKDSFWLQQREAKACATAMQCRHRIHGGAKACSRTISPLLSNQLVAAAAAAVVVVVVVDDDSGTTTDTSAASEKSSFHNSLLHKQKS